MTDDRAVLCPACRGTGLRWSTERGALPCGPDYELREVEVENARACEACGGTGRAANV